MIGLVYFHISSDGVGNFIDNDDYGYKEDREYSGYNIF